MHPKDMHPNRYEVSPVEAAAIEAQKRLEQRTWNEKIDDLVLREPGTAVNNTPKSVNFAYSEGESLAELTAYIAATYGEHYAKAGSQLFDHFLGEPEQIEHFCKLSAAKYILRFGHKAGRNRKDILKALHYLVLMLHFSKEVDNK